MGINNKKILDKRKEKVGEVHFTNEGYKVEIIEYFRYSNVTIKFEDGTIREKVDYKALVRGGVKKPLSKEKFITNEGYEIEIVKYFGTFNCTIKFNDKRGTILEGISVSAIKRGSVKNPYHPSVYGIGYNGVGKFKARDGSKMSKTYDVWHSMLQRCYSEKQQQKQPTYRGCSVHPDWHNFQVFAEWFKQKYKLGFVLDKDILKKGNKVYSPETCCFVPQEINNIILKNDIRRGEHPLGVSKNGSGFAARVNINQENKTLGYFKTPEKAFQAYKKAKEKEIKKLAKFYKNDLIPQAYQALMNYKIEITD